jgi:hypothetical protein
MWRTFNALMAIQTATYVNIVLHYARKLPLLRRVIRDSVFARVRFKRALAVVVRLAVLAGQVVFALGYVGIMLYVPVLGIGQELAQEQKLWQFAHQLFLLSFVVAGVSMAAILEPKRGKYIAVKLMRMSPAEYMKATLGHKYAWYFLRMVLAIIVFGGLLGASAWQAALMAAAATMTRVLWEYAHLKVFERTGVVIIRKTGLVWAVILTGFALAYAPLFLSWAPSIGWFVLQWPFLLILIAAGLIAADRLARYRDYRTVVEAATRRDDPLMDLGKVMAEANQASVRMDVTDYALEPAGAESAGKDLAARNSSGYAYLNELFFARHRRLVSRPVHIRLAVLAGAGVAGLAAAYLFTPELSRYLAMLLEYKLPVLLLVMLYLSTGDRLCRAFFYHCDLSMLRYRFYRNDTYRHYRIRLGRLIGQNVLLGAVLAAVLTVVFLWTASLAGSGIGTVWDSRGRELAMMWICVLALAVFFSVHHLFLYYMLQPFTTEFNVKNPLYMILHSVIGSICGIGLFIRVPSPAFAIAAAALALIYALSSLAAVRRHGSRTFRVK